MVATLHDVAGISFTVGDGGNRQDKMITLEGKRKQIRQFCRFQCVRRRHQEDVGHGAFFMKLGFLWLPDVVNVSNMVGGWKFSDSNGMGLSLTSLLGRDHHGLESHR